MLSGSKVDALRAIGIGFRVDDETIRKYHGYRIDLKKSSGETRHAQSAPPVFIRDSDGILQFSFVHPDYRVRVPGCVILAAAKATPSAHSTCRQRVDRDGLGAGCAHATMRA